MEVLKAAQCEPGTAAVRLRCREAHAHARGAPRRRASHRDDGARGRRALADWKRLPTLCGHAKNHMQRIPEGPSIFVTNGFPFCIPYGFNVLTHDLNVRQCLPPHGALPTSSRSQKCTPPRMHSAHRRGADQDSSPKRVGISYRASHFLYLVRHIPYNQKLNHAPGFRFDRQHTPGVYRRCD